MWSACRILLVMPYVQQSCAVVRYIVPEFWQSPKHTKGPCQPLPLSLFAQITWRRDRCKINLTDAFVVFESLCVSTWLHLSWSFSQRRVGRSLVIWCLSSFAYLIFSCMKPHPWTLILEESLSLSFIFSSVSLQYLCVSMPSLHPKRFCRPH